MFVSCNESASINMFIALMVFAFYPRPVFTEFILVV